MSARDAVKREWRDHLKKVNQRSGPPSIVRHTLLAHLNLNATPVLMSSRDHEEKPKSFKEWYDFLKSTRKLTTNTLMSRSADQLPRGDVVKSVMVSKNHQLDVQRRPVSASFSTCQKPKNHKLDVQRRPVSASFSTCQKPTVEVRSRSLDPAIVIDDTSKTTTLTSSGSANSRRIYSSRDSLTDSCDGDTISINPFRNDSGVGARSKSVCSLTPVVPLGMGATSHKEIFYTKSSSFDKSSFEFLKASANSMYASYVNLSDDDLPRDEENNSLCFENNLFQENLFQKRRRSAIS